ncbi:hypothetical protein HDV63DRAFT_268573 [Trichoderma sp. SZMC 28014]
MLQTEIEQSLRALFNLTFIFACGKFGESFKARGGYVPLLCSFSMPGASSWPPDVCLSSLPVMAWRHPDVCNRHQKSQAREDPRLYYGKTRVSFSVSYGKSLRSLLRKLECDMQRLFCFGETNHTIPIILLRAMLHLFFSSDVSIEQRWAIQLPLSGVYRFPGLLWPLLSFLALLRCRLKRKPHGEAIALAQQI